MDWLTGNIYLAIQYERRIRVCDGNSYACIEILGDFVGDTVCDIQLVPQKRCLQFHDSSRSDGCASKYKRLVLSSRLFWLDVEPGRHPTVRATLKTARMNGENANWIVWHLNMRQSNCPCIAIDHANLSIYLSSRDHSGIHRVEEYGLEGEFYRRAYLGNRNDIPIHIYASKGELIWVGRPSHSNESLRNETDVILTTRIRDDTVLLYPYDASQNLSRVTGLTYYGFSPNWMNSSMKEREKHLCPGVRLSSANGSLRCACPGGTKPTADGLSCKSKYTAAGTLKAQYCVA